MRGRSRNRVSCGALSFFVRLRRVETLRWAQSRPVGAWKYASAARRKYALWEIARRGNEGRNAFAPKTRSRAAKRKPRSQRK